MLQRMQAPTLDIFEWLLKNAEHARYNLAYSDITGLSLKEYTKLAKYSLPADFNLGINRQYGATELKDTLCSMYHCTADNVVTSTGASEANYLVYSSLLDNGDEFIIERPGYQPLRSTPEMFGAKRIDWPRPFENKFRINVEALKALCTKNTKLIVLTNLHNPSGVYTDIQTIKAVAEVAIDHGAYVLVDEIYHDGAFTQNPSCFGLPNVLVTSSATKVYGLGGLHTGWIIAPEEVAKSFQKMKAHTTAASSLTSELMTAHLLKNARDAMIARFQKQAVSNLAVLKKWMTQQTDVLNWVVPDGGLVCFPKYSIDVPSVDLCRRLFIDQKILINPGKYFNAEGFIRLSYGIKTEMLQEGLEALAKGLHNIMKSASP